MARSRRNPPGRDRFHIVIVSYYMKALSRSYKISGISLYHTGCPKGFHALFVVTFTVM